MWLCNIRSGSPNWNIVITATPPRLLLDNRIYAVTGTSFCVPSGRWGGAVTDSLRRWWIQAVRAINATHETGCGRPDAITTQITMVLLHGSLRTWGEFLRRAPALAKRWRMRGYDAVTLSAACNSPALCKQGCRGAWQIRQTKSKSDTMGRVCGSGCRRPDLFMWFW